MRSRSSGGGQSGLCVLSEVHTSETDRERGTSGGVRLEHMGGILWWWSYGEESGLARGADEAIVAIGKAVLARHGVEAQRAYLLGLVKQLL